MRELLIKLLQTLHQAVSQQQYGESEFILEKMAFQALSMLGMLKYEKDHDLASAEKYIGMAATLDENSWGLYSNLAHIYCQEGKYEQALIAISQSVLLANGEQAEPLFNAGVILSNLKMTQPAIDSFRQAKNAPNAPPSASYNLATSLLLDGQYEEGWQEFENRFVLNEIKQVTDRFTQPFWKGEDFKNKTLFVFNEQGLGDLIQFSRYLPLVKERGGKVVLEVQPELIDLLIHNKHLGFDELVPRHTLTYQPEADYVCSILSLPAIFPNAEISGTSYYRVDGLDNPFGNNLILTDCYVYKVGICWAGSHIHALDASRSCELKSFERMSNLLHIQLTSLQHNPERIRHWKVGDVDLRAGSENVKYEQPEIKSMFDVARYIAHLDLVITVDTAIAHLAGAMGKPVWVLLPYVNDWRWLENHSDSPWYSTVRLFRQRQRGSWNEVFDEVYGLLSSGSW